MGSGYRKLSHDGELVRQSTIKKHNVAISTISCKSKQNTHFKWQPLPSFIQPTHCCMLTGLHRQVCASPCASSVINFHSDPQGHQSHKVVGQWLRAESECHAPQEEKEREKGRNKGTKRNRTPNSTSVSFTRLSISEKKDNSIALVKEQFVYRMPDVAMFKHSQ